MKNNIAHLVISTILILRTIEGRNNFLFLKDKDWNSEEPSLPEFQHIDHMYNCNPATWNKELKFNLQDVTIFLHHPTMSSQA